MSQTISGSYIGTAATRHRKAGAGLTQGPQHEFGTIAYSGMIQGGEGYSTMQYGVSGSGGAGGIGVVVIADLVNFGTVSGGAGGNGLIPADGSGNGGIGVKISETGHLVNYGGVTGGNGGCGSRSFPKLDGAGGIGVDLVAGGFLANRGEIAGGAGGESYALNAPQGGPGGAGISFGGSITLYNLGGISGGDGGVGSGYTAGAGGNGVEAKNGGYLTNDAGNIKGGNGGAGGSPDAKGGVGGVGILLHAATNVTNGGKIHGGNGGDSSELAGAGGAGLQLAGGFLSNYGVISGGNGGDSGPVPNGFGAAGGIGVEIGRNGFLFNFTQIYGGEGGNDGGHGGAGVVLHGASASSTIADINFGLISGGSAAPSFGTPGYGGIGLEMLRPGTFVNFGTITGGAGAVAKVHAAITYGGGAYFAGGSMLKNDGLIRETGNSDALLFGNAGKSTLALDAGSRIIGIAQAEGSRNVLELSGTPSPKYGTTLSGLGTDYVGFQTLAVDASSYWTVAGNVQSVSNAGTIAIATGTSLDVTGRVDKASTGIFALTGAASLEIGAVLGTGTQIDFLGTSGGNLLTIDDPSQFGLHVGKTDYLGPTLADFSAGESIDLKGIGTAVRTEYYSQTGILQIQSNSGAALASLAFQTASLGPGVFQLSPDSDGGTLLTRS